MHGTHLFEVLDLTDCHLQQSIYPEYVSSQNLEGDFKLEIPVELGSPRSVIISEPIASTTSTPERKPTCQTLSLSTLPPLLIHLILPPAYPIHKPPQIVSIRATHVWLTETAPLQEALLELWQAGEPTLYNWVEYVRTGDFLEKMNLVSSNHADIIMCVTLITSLRAFAELYP